MGHHKEMLMKQQAEGWSSVGDKYCCSECFEDPAIKEFIKEHATSRECSYCGRKGRKPVAVWMDELLSFISEGLHREYEPPENNIPWDSAEGGWQLPVMDTDDLLQDLGFECNEALFDDLVSAFSDRQWVQRDPFGLTERDTLLFTWESFCEQVKHQCRFVFFELQADRWLRDDTGHARPHEILETIGALVREFNLVTTMPVDTMVCRVRSCKHPHRPVTAKEFGPPPKKKAEQSRMSSAGIPVLYCADSAKTARREAMHANPKDKRLYAIGSLTTLRPLQVLDLTQLPEIPSLFDKGRWIQRMRLTFLHSFNYDVSKPIKRGRQKHYEYVPTQVVAEYFRYVFEHEGRKGLDGIKFASSCDPGGSCYALFPTHDPRKPNLWLESTLKLARVRTVTLPPTSKDA